MAPARASFRATVESSDGTKSRRIFDPAVERMPRVQMLSLSVIGIPRRGKSSRREPRRAEQLLFRAPRRGQRVFGGDRQERVQRGIVPLDAAQKQLGQLDGGNLAFCQQRGKFLDRGKRERFFVLHGQKIFSSRRRFPNVPMFAMFSETRN